MTLYLPTHSVTRLDNVNYAIPVYYELWQNGNLIKATFAPVGGFNNNLSKFKENNHPVGAAIDVPTGLMYEYTFKFWHLGEINMKALLVCHSADTEWNYNSAEAINGAAFEVAPGSYQQFNFFLTPNSSNWSKINFNPGYIDSTGHYQYNSIKPGTTLADITGTTTAGEVVKKLGHRLFNNSQVEFYNLASGLFTGARIPNNETIAGVANPYYEVPVIVIPPSTVPYYHFNAFDYFDVYKNPAVRSPISFCYGTPATALATVEAQLMRKQNNELTLCVPPNNTGPYIFVKNELPINAEIIDGWLFSKSNGTLSYCIIFNNPLNSRAGVKIKANIHTYWQRPGKVTIITSESTSEHNIEFGTENVFDFISTAAINKIYVFIQPITPPIITNSTMGLNLNCEFFCENNGEIAEPYLYKEDAHLFLGTNEIPMKLFETFTSTTDYTDLTTIPETAWQPNNIISLPAAGVYHIYGRATLQNDDKQVYKIRSFTQS